MNKSLNRDYVEQVTQGDFPKSSVVPLDDYFSDFRGSINNLLLSPINSVARITSQRGTIRANHYHLTDWHYAFVESGELYYFEREIGSDIVPDPQKIMPGTMFFTPPNVEHAMLFTRDTVFFTFARNIRSHESHESDLVRVSFVTDDVARRFLK
jgi:hypothetical protein